MNSIKEMLATVPNRRKSLRPRITQAAFAEQAGVSFSLYEKFESSIRIRNTVPSIGVDYADAILATIDKLEAVQQRGGKAA